MVAGVLASLAELELELGRERRAAAPVAGARPLSIPGWPSPKTPPQMDRAPAARYDNERMDIDYALAWHLADFNQRFAKQPPVHEDKTT